MRTSKIAIVTAMLSFGLAGPLYAQASSAGGAASVNQSGSNVNQGSTNGSNTAAGSGNGTSAASSNAAGSAMGDGPGRSRTAPQ